MENKDCESGEIKSDEIKSDPAIDRIKREECGRRSRSRSRSRRRRSSSRCSTPSSGSIKPSAEGKEGRKPLKSVRIPPFSTLQRPASNLCACHQAPPPTSPPYDHLRSRRSNKIRKWYRTAGTVLVVCGGCGDHVRARFNKQDMVIELSVRRSRNATWQPESVEKEVFQQLNEAGLRIEPVGGWGFLDFVKNAVSVLPCLSVGPARHVC